MVKFQQFHLEFQNKMVALRRCETYGGVGIFFYIIDKIMLLLILLRLNN